MVIALVTIIGALIPTFILSRLLLWSLKRWQAPHWRLIVAHGLSLSIAIVIAGLGNADGGSFAGERSVAIYAPAQAFWLIVDFIRHFRSSRMRPNHHYGHSSDGSWPLASRFRPNDGRVRVFRIFVIRSFRYARAAHDPLRIRGYAPLVLGDKVGIAGLSLRAAE